jgi:hypothetical protein
MPIKKFDIKRRFCPAHTVSTAKILGVTTMEKLIFSSCKYVVLSFAVQTQYRAFSPSRNTESKYVVLSMFYIPPILDFNSII